MSFFVIGLLEFDKDVGYGNLNNKTRELACLALDHSYSLQLGYFHNEYYREFLTKATNKYNISNQKSLEFELADSPYSGSFDEGIYKLQKQLQGDGNNIYTTSLYQFFSELWNKDNIKVAVMIFSYGLYDYNLLKHKTATLNQMFEDMSKYYLKGTEDQNSCYFLKK